VEGSVKMEIKPHARLCDFIGNDDLLLKHKEPKLRLADIVSYLGEFELFLQPAEDDYDRVIAYFSAFPNKTGMLDHPHYAFQFVYKNPGFVAALRKEIYRVTTQPKVEIRRCDFWYTAAHIMKAFMQSMVELSTFYEGKENALSVLNITASNYNGIISQMLEMYVRYTGDLLIKARDYISVNQTILEFGESKKLLKEISLIYTGDVQPERADFMLHFNCKTHPYLRGSKIRR
jgi:hypothetical protein